MFASANAEVQWNKGNMLSYFMFQLLRANKAVIELLEKFRKEQIGEAKVSSHCYIIMRVIRYIDHGISPSVYLQIIVCFLGF